MNAPLRTESPFPAVAPDASLAPPGAEGTPLARPETTAGAREAPASPTRESTGWHLGTKRYAGLGVGYVSKPSRRPRWRWRFSPGTGAPVTGEAKSLRGARIACDEAARGVAAARPARVVAELAPAVPRPLALAGGCMACLELAVALAPSEQTCCVACRGELRRAPAPEAVDADPQRDGAALALALREIEGGAVGLEVSTAGKGSAPEGYRLDEHTRRRALDAMRRLHALGPDEQLALFYAFVWCGTSERARWDAGRTALGPWGGFDEQLGRLLAPDLQTLVAWRTSPTPSLAADAARRLGRAARERGIEHYAALPVAAGLLGTPSAWLASLRDEVSRRLARVERARAMGEALASMAKGERLNRKRRREAIQRVGNTGNA